MPLNSFTKLTVFKLLHTSVQPRNLPRVSISKTSNILSRLKNGRNTPLAGLSIRWRVMIIFSRRLVMKLPIDSDTRLNLFNKGNFLWVSDKEKLQDGN